MFSKECRICGTWFDAKTERRQLCDECQKDSAKAQSKIDKSILKSRYRLGEMPNQQYYPGQCLYCGREFHSYGRSREFCCTECSEQHNAENAVCPICNCKLYPLGIFAKKGTKCCSEKCDIERKIREARSRGKTTSCKECSKEFIKKKDWDEFCCKDCEKLYAFALAMREGRVVKCKVCSKVFIRKYTEQETCNTYCHEVHRKMSAPPLVERKCEICGASFLKHVNAKQYTCGKACATIRQKAKGAAAKKKS